MKLLNVASGNFDGIYTQRFKGSKNQPPPAEKPNLLDKIKQVDPLSQIFQCPSFTDVSKSYTVDMLIGICSCKVGFNGKICKHQYFFMGKSGC